MLVVVHRHEGPQRTARAAIIPHFAECLGGAGIQPIEAAHEGAIEEPNQDSCVEAAAKYALTVRHRRDSVNTSCVPGPSVDLTLGYFEFVLLILNVVLESAGAY